MNSAAFKQLVEVVGGAMDLPADARDAFLETACANDPSLLAEARSWVAEAEGASLEAVTARLEGMIEREARAAAGDGAGDPERIGRYEILRVLGRGGMGVVYLGRQHDPVKRDVAIKVIRRGIGGDEALLRFAAEAQAMALMQHPNVARLFETGETDDGRPFFVMELVEGLPLTRYAAAEKLSLQARLELFRSVCLGVQHAHQRGVIHRDLKPSNILVVPDSDGPVAKVIDFGIAKAVDGLLTKGGVQTHDGSLLGTVDYMSPEQIRGDSAEIDVRTDVYSLGVVLYELVTGKHPFDGTTLRRGGLVEAQRLILETQPRRPSRAGTRSTPAAGGSMTGRPREELDWVVMKALEKDPDRRYSSPRELAEDIGRYLADEPIVARPPSVVYRTRKFARRHRVAVTAASLTVAALLVGTAMSVRGSLVASAEAERAQAISDFLTDMLASVLPEQEGRSVTVREVLDDARGRLEAGEFSQAPHIDASLSHVIAYSYEGLGRYPEAIELYERAASLREAQGDEEELFRTRYRLGTVLWKRGDLEEALQLRHELARTTERLFGLSHWEHAESLSNLANTYADMGELDRAALNLREAVEVGRRLEGREGELHLARFLNNLGTVYDDQEDFPAALEAFVEALSIREQVEGEHSEVVAITLSNVGGTQAAMGDLRGAEATYRRAIALDEEIYGPDHSLTAFAYSGLATVLAAEGRYEEAERLTRVAVAIRVAASGGNWRVANERVKLAGILSRTGRTEEAMAELQTAWSGLEDAGEDESRGARVAAAIADLLVSMGRPDEAETWTARAGGG